MPTGPQGQKRPADAIGLAVMIGKIATGEIADGPIREPRGRAGGLARATALSADQRSEIASAGAGARWDAHGREERVMSTVTKRGASVAEGSALRMYPNNELKAQVRPFAETFSGFSLLRERFGKK